MAGESPDKPLDINLTHHQWVAAKRDFYNGVFKTGTDAMLLFNIIEAILDKNSYIPPTSEDDWVRPSIKLTLLLLFVIAGTFSNLQGLRNASASFHSANVRRKAEEADKSPDVGDPGSQSPRPSRI